MARANAEEAKAAAKEAKAAAKEEAKAAAKEAKAAEKAAKAAAKAAEKEAKAAAKAAAKKVPAPEVQVYIQKPETPVIADAELEEELEVTEVEWRGRSYLMDDDGNLYDDAHEAVGTWSNHGVSGSEPVWA